MGLISGLAAACFAKASRRVPRVARSHEAGERMKRLPSVSRWRSWRCCVGDRLAAPAIVSSLASVVAGATGLAESQVRVSLQPHPSLSTVVAVFAD